MTEEQEREAFEAWADDQGFVMMRTVRGDDYQDLRTQGPWEAWQARASLPSNPEHDTYGAPPVGAGNDKAPATTEQRPSSANANDALTAFNRWRLPRAVENTQSNRRLWVAGFKAGRELA